MVNDTNIFFSCSLIAADSPDSYNREALDQCRIKIFNFDVWRVVNKVN